MSKRIAYFGGPVLLLTLVLFSASAFAQIDGGSLGSAAAGGTTNFRFAEPNELTIIVCLLGEVQRPGRYEISRTINLLDLVALAGGFTPQADPSDVSITRFTQAGTSVQRHEFKLDLQNATRVPENYAVLAQGDFIQVGRQPTLTFDRMLMYITTAAVIVTAYVTIATYKNTN